jgi:hypothetical protein
VDADGGAEDAAEARIVPARMSSSIRAPKGTRP